MTTQESITYPHAEVCYNTTTTVTREPVSLQNNLPLLPFDLWQQIVSWLCDVSVQKNCEGVMSLTIVDNEWVPIVWHQTAPSSLHVKFDESSDINQQLLNDATREALQRIHCTIHSHNTVAASQSSDDARDEAGKSGWHITIGHCQSDRLSSHTRYSCKQNATFGDAGTDMAGKKLTDAHQEFIVMDLDTAVATPELPDGFPREFLKDSDELLLTNYHVPYPEVWLDRVDNVKSNTYLPIHAPYHYKQTTTAINWYRTFNRVYLSEKNTWLSDPNWVLCQLLYQTLCKQHTTLAKCKDLKTLTTTVHLNSIKFLQKQEIDINLSELISADELHELVTTYAADDYYADIDCGTVINDLYIDYLEIQRDPLLSTHETY